MLKKNIVSFKKKKKNLSQTPEPSNYNWPDSFVLKHALCFCFFFFKKRAISQHVMLQPDKFVISNISKHLARKEKHLTLFLESKNRESCYI